MHPSGKRRRSKTKGHRTQSSVGHRTCINKQRPQLQATGTRRAKDTSQAPKATGPMAKATGHWSLLIACRRLLSGEGHKSKGKSHRPRITMPRRTFSPLRAHMPHPSGKRTLVKGKRPQFKGQRPHESADRKPLAPVEQMPQLEMHRRTFCPRRATNQRPKAKAMSHKHPAGKRCRSKAKATGQRPKSKSQKLQLP